MALLLLGLCRFDLILLVSETWQNMIDFMVNFINVVSFGLNTESMLRFLIHNLSWLIDWLRYFNLFIILFTQNGFFHFFNLSKNIVFLIFIIFFIITRTHNIFCISVILRLISRLTLDTLGHINRSIMIWWWLQFFVYLLWIFTIWSLIFFPYLFKPFVWRIQKRILTVP